MKIFTYTYIKQNDYTGYNFYYIYNIDKILK